MVGVRATGLLAHGTDLVPTGLSGARLWIGPATRTRATKIISACTTNEIIALGAASTSLDEMPSTEKDLNETLKQLRLLEKQCTDLEKAVSELEDKNQALQSNVFSLGRFTSDEAMLFYTGFPNYKVFLASFEYLDPGDNGENVRYWLSCDIEIPSEHYESLAQLGVKRGRPRSLKPQEDFFLILCRLRQGFAETHLSHLFNVSQATIRRIIISWINLMYFRFGVLNISPSREAVKGLVRN